MSRTRSNLALAATAALAAALPRGGTQAAQAAGADFAYIGSMFIATDEANAEPDYKQMIVDSTASDIIYSNLFTGVHGTYLRGSIIAAGLDPDALPGSDSAAMNFAGGSAKDAKAWRDVWGAGHGIGKVDAVRPAAAVIDRLIEEYKTEHLTPYPAAEHGWVDRVIAPHETRREIARGLRLMDGRRREQPLRAHGNIPL